MAAAAYRAGAVLHDERRGFTHRYQHRKGVVSSFILTPPNAPEITRTRALLWNAAEASETRKNSRVAREVILALPHELTDTERKTLASDMALYLVERYRVAVDVAVHSPVVGDGHDPRNHHAHLLFTTREVTKDGLGKKTRILDDKQAGPQEVELLREVWETLANDALARAGFSDVKIDRRTLEGQGIDRIPQTHEGKASKNAMPSQSLLAKDFREAERDDKEDESGEGEDEGKKGGKSGKGEKDGGAKLSSKTREDSKGRKIDYPALDQKQTRTTFNAEIKALNEKRAAFGDKPLKEQIAQLDRLMERLDKRVEKLQQLENKTSLKSIIKESILGVVKLAADLFVNRKEVSTALKLTAEEKQARKERQITRYGRSYREGLHHQIDEMKQNMAVVEVKREDFKRYKSFVDKIESDLKKQVLSITIPLKEQTHPAARQVTDKEVNLKLYLKAEMIRAQIPEEYRALSSMKDDRKTLTISIAVNKILQTKAEPITIDRSAFSKPQASTQEIAKSTAPPVKAEFTNKVQVQLMPKIQAEYKQPMPVRIKALEQTIAQRQAEKAEVPNPADRKNWFIPASEKMRPLQRSIEVAIKQQRQEVPQARPSTEAQNKFSKAQEPPSKTATYSEVREKVRAEAESKRASVPPEYRAEPYEIKTEAPTPEHKTAEAPETATQSTFNEAASTDDEPKPSKPKMNAHFNARAGFNDASQTKAAPGQEERPEVDL